MKVVVLLKKRKCTEKEKSTKTKGDAFVAARVLFNKMRRTHNKPILYLTCYTIYANDSC